MNFTLTADAPIKVPDVDAICLKKVKRLAIPEEEQNKIKDAFGKGQSMQEEKNENEQAGTYTVDGLPIGILMYRASRYRMWRNLDFR